MGTRLAIISDIHANVEAFEEVLKHISSRSVDRIICLGDLVGYNADPSACIALCREHNIFCLLGNHDAAVCGKIPLDDFNASAAAAIKWTSKQLSKGEFLFLNQLPRFQREGSRYLLMHGSLLDPDRYLFFQQDAEKDFEEMQRSYPDVSLGFFGHTHQRIIFTYYLDTVTSGVPENFTLEPGRLYLINPGSVGQPRDNNPMASYLIYDEDRGHVTFHHVLYDVKKAAEKVMKAGLPKSLAERLFRGW